MEYKCTAFTGVYGVYHELKICDKCKDTYCECTKLLRICFTCKDCYCIDCLKSNNILTNTEFCNCLVCKNCAIFRDYTKHGNDCKHFEWKFKVMLYNLFVPDITDSICNFLWDNKTIST